MNRFLSRATHVSGAVGNYLLPLFAGITVVFITVLPLFSLERVFAIDWINHLWLINYFGNYIHENALPPSLLNTQEIAGIPLTLFYAGKFYTVLGYISAFAGSAIAVRVATVVTLLLQYFCVARVLGGPRKLAAVATAASVTWATYSLTNLYNRSALTEFFAVCFLTCALTSFLNLLLRSADGESVSPFDLTSTGLFYSAAAISHPITAIFGALLIGTLGVASLSFGASRYRRFILLYGTINTLAIGAVLSSWFYLIWHFRGQLPVADSTSNAAAFRNLGFYPASLDNFWSRLSPIPVDLRSVASGIHDVSTPYLDAQIAVPLLIITLALAMSMSWFGLPTTRDDRSKIFPAALFAVSICLSLFFFVVSVRPQISSGLGGLFDIMQFPYRLVTYVNLSLLCAIIAISRFLDTAKIQRHKISELGVALAFGVALSGVTLKLVHAIAVASTPKSGYSLPVARPTVSPFGAEDPRNFWLPLPFASAKNADHLPVTFYGAAAYTVATGFQFAPQPGTVPTIYCSLEVELLRRFGNLAPAHVDVESDSLVVTNVMPFPWNHLVIDGIDLPQSSIIVAQLSNAGTPVGAGLSVMLPPGKHKIEARLVPTPAWRILDAISWFTLIVWSVLVLAAIVDHFRTIAWVILAQTTSAEGGRNLTVGVPLSE